MAGQAAIRYQRIPLRTKHHFNRHRAWLAPVELERRQEVYVVDRLDMPAGNNALSGFCKSLDAHHTGQHRGAIDLMIVQKWLNGGVKRGLDGEAPVKAHAGQLTEHRSSRR